MKIKEIEKTVNTSWSPGDHHPILLAAGTAAQQLDASFNTSAALEIYALNLQEPSLDLELKLSVPCQQRFHKVVWGGISPGIIVGGCDNGILEIFSAEKLFKNEEGRIDSPERHTGSVRSLDFNPYQKNLLATGASNSEIYIWDMNNTSTPMTPGAKSQPLEDVAWLAWNRQVQHILASTFSTRCVVWDLRKSEPIIKLTDTTTRVRWKVVAWHPEVATQLCLASEEDTNPVIQLWDLRFATAPVKTFNGHNRGVLSVAWCSQDPDLLISSGKDNKILCWNPNANNPEGEIVCEIPNSQQWIFDVSWCPRNPSLIVSSSCDGHTSIYSLTGSPGQAQVSNKIADSFPGMDNYSDQQVQAPHQTVDLKKAPKWLRRPAGAKFGFGGKLVTFGPEGVNLFQTKVEPEFLDKARDLESKVSQGRQYEICQGKRDPIWRYLEACYTSDPAIAIRDLLGYSEETVISALGIQPKEKLSHNHIEGLNDQMSHLGRDGYDYPGGQDGQMYGNHEVVNGTDVFDSLSKKQEANAAEQKPMKINVGNDIEGKVCQALLVGRVEEAVDLCLENDRLADALVLAHATGPEALARIHQKYFEKNNSDSLCRIIKAVVTEEWESVIQNCELSSWKEALAVILTYKKNASQLADLLGARLERAGGEYAQCAEVCYIASGNINPLVRKRTSGVPLSVDNIQELVELILVAQGAMNMRGLQLLLVDDVAKLLGQYSALLSSEGELEVALSFLRDCQDDDVDLLKDRLSYALGIKSLPQYSQTNRISSAAQNVPSAFRPPSQGIPKVGNPYNAGLNNQINRRDSNSGNAFSKPLSGPGMPVSGMPPTPIPSAATYNQQLIQSPKSSAPPPPTGPPAPATNFTRNSPSPGIQGGSTKKYVLDPSVAGNNMPTNSYGMYGNQPGGYGAPAQPYSFQGPQQPAAQAFSPRPPVQTYPGSQPDAMTSQPFSNSFAPSSGMQNFYKPSQTPPPQSLVYNPTQNSAFKGGISNIPQQPGVLSSQNNPASGWNDPPSVGPKSSQPRQDVAQQAPITHPLYGASPPQPEYSPQQGYPGSQQNYGQQQHPPMGHQGHQPSPMGQQHPPMGQHPSIGQHPPMGQQLPPMLQPQAPPPSQQLSHQPLSGYGEPPVEMAKMNQPSQPKLALPQEYLHIQTTFEELRNKCVLASHNNPLMKRKLDDVARKLEAMYDCLTNGKLPPSALAGLEQLVQCVQSSDFHSGLGVITQMVSGSDFSSVSPFMTGVKILLQTAQQLRVN
ncbi:WD domain, G-beta repeat [Nesidiocoris tenuis]|uniref:WD domain, G-beta repeat n=1 Tax=Nesidiocoris tenuis TaxID=355587 RepID=A0ABN7AKP8_9HEMI|nr:WD domain, G-beta repeat [Nesidiocoris tenuis]